MNKLFFVAGLLFVSLATASEESVTLKKAETGDLRALNQAFLLHTKSDGGNAEDIDIAIGKSIAHNPKNFLTALKSNRPKVPRLEATLGNLGPEYVDDFKSQRLELQRRLSAIQSVKDKSLVGVRTECEAQLKKQIERTPAD